MFVCTTIVIFGPSHNLEFSLKSSSCYLCGMCFTWHIYNSNVNIWKCRHFTFAIIHNCQCRQKHTILWNYPSSLSKRTKNVIWFALIRFVNKYRSLLLLTFGPFSCNFASISKNSTIWSETMFSTKIFVPSYLEKWFVSYLFKQDWRPFSPSWRIRL